MILNSYIGVEGTGNLAGEFVTRSARAGGFVFSTLHHGYDPETYDPTTEIGVLPADIADQTTFALCELELVLREAGTDFRNATRVAIYVDSNDVEEVERARASYAVYVQQRDLRRAPFPIILGAALVDFKVGAEVIAAVDTAQARISQQTPPERPAPIYEDVRLSSQRENTEARLVFLGAEHMPAVDTSDATLADQVECCLSRINAALGVHGGDVRNLVKVSTFLSAELMTKTNYAAYNVAYDSFFSQHGIVRKPARSTIGVRFVKTAQLVEMDAIAVV